MPKKKQTLIEEMRKSQFEIGEQVRYWMSSDLKPDTYDLVSLTAQLNSIINTVIEHIETKVPKKYRDKEIYYVKIRRLEKFDNTSWS